MRPFAALSMPIQRHAPLTLCAALLVCTAGCDRDQEPVIDSVPTAHAQELPPPEPTPEPTEPEPIPLFLPADRLAAEPFGPDPELLHMRPEYSQGQRFELRLTRHEETVLSAQSDARVVATTTESHVATSCIVELEETEKYEPHVFTVRFAASTGSTATETGESQALAGARWRCGARGAEVTCTDVDSGDDFAPPPWLVFFHARWIPQRVAEADFAWNEPDTRMIGWPTEIGGGMDFVVADVNAESGEVALQFEVDGTTELTYFGGQSFVARGEGEVTIDTQARTLTGVRYVMDTFVAPDDRGRAPLQQRRSHITYDLRVGPAPH